MSKFVDATLSANTQKKFLLIVFKHYHNTNSSLDNEWK